MRTTNWNFSARPPLSTVTTASSVCAAATKAEKRSAAATAPSIRHRSLAGVLWLLYVCKAAAEEPNNKTIWYARQSRQKPPQTRILLCPQPRGEIIDSGLSSNQRQCSAPQHNIIPSGLCNRSLGPQPHRLFPLSHTIRIMLSCSIRAFYTVILCRCRVGGSYGFAEGRDHPSLNPLSQDLALVYMSVIPSGTVSGPQPSCLPRWPEVRPVRTSVVCDSHHSHHPLSGCGQAATSALRAGSALAVTPYPPLRSR